MNQITSFHVFVSHLLCVYLFYRLVFLAGLFFERFFDILFRGVLPRWLLIWNIFFLIEVPSTDIRNGERTIFRAIIYETLCNKRRNQSVARIVLLPIFLFLEVFLYGIFVIWWIQGHTNIFLASFSFIYFLRLFQYDAMPTICVILQTGPKIQGIFYFAISPSLSTIYTLFKTRSQISLWVNSLRLLFLHYFRVNCKRIRGLAIFYYSSRWKILLKRVFILIKVCKAIKPFELTLEAFPVFDCVKATSKVPIVRFGDSTWSHSLQILKNWDKFRLYLQVLT